MADTQLQGSPGSRNSALLQKMSIHAAFTLFLASKVVLILDHLLINCLCSRPRTIDEVAHQEEVVQTLNNALSSGNVSFSEPLHLHFSLSICASPAQPPPPTPLFFCSSPIFYSTALPARVKLPPLWPLSASFLAQNC